MMKKGKSPKFLLKATAILTSFLGAGLMVNGTQQVAANSGAVNTTVTGTTESSSTSTASAPATSTETSTTATTTASTVAPAQSTAPSASAPAATQPARTTVNANATVTPALDGAQTQVNGTTTPANGAQVNGTTTTDTTGTANAPLTPEEAQRILRNIELEMIKIGENIIAGKYKSEKDLGEAISHVIETKTEERTEMGIAALAMSLVLVGDAPIEEDDNFSQEFKDMVAKVNEKPRFANVGSAVTKAVYLKESDLATFGETDVAKAINLDHSVPNVFIQEVRGLDKLRAAKHGEEVELEVLLLAAEQPDLIAHSVDLKIIVDNQSNVKINFGGAVRHPLLKSELGTVIPGAFRSSVGAGFGVPVAATLSSDFNKKTNASSARSNTSGSSQSGSTTTAARSLNLPSTGETQTAVIVAAGLATLGLAGFLLFRHRTIKK